MAYSVNGCWTVLSNVGIGTDDLATYHPEFMSPSLNIVGSRPGINFKNTSGSLGTIRLAGTAPAGEMHINFNGASCTNGGLYFYAYGCSNRSVLTLGLNGNVGIGIDAPFSPHNGNGLVVKGNGGDTRGIIELHDGGASGGKSVLQQVGGDTYIGQLAKGTGAGNLHLLTGGAGNSATISMTILCAGNVGIGTVTPDSRLHICNAVAGGTNNYSVIIQNACTVADARAGIAFSNNSQTPSQGGLSGASIQTSNNGIDGTGSLIFGTLLNGTNTERMRISHNGQVGIGTTTPSIYGLTFTNQFTVSSTTTYANITVAGSSGSGGGIDFGNQTVRHAGVYSLDGSDLGFYTNGTNSGNGLNERIRITSSGRVGVGTDSPASRFHINHTSSQGACTIILQTTDTCANGTISWRSCAGVTQAQIGSNYNVGDSSGNLEFITSGNTRLLVTSGGNIGMGTTSPSYRLHVNGTFYAAGSSIEYKESISQYDTDSCLFMCLKPKTYQYKDEWKHLGKDLKSGTQIGLIAEEVAEVMPELAVLVNEEENKVVRNVDYEKLSIILLSEVQKLRKEVDNLKNNK